MLSAKSILYFIYTADYLRVDLIPGVTLCKMWFLPLFNLLPFHATKSPGFLTRFVSRSTLLLHRSNVRSYSKPPVSSGKLPKHGIKRRFSNVIDACACPAHTGNGRGSEFLASIVGLCKSIQSDFDGHSCYCCRVISVWIAKFAKCAKLPLLSNSLTNIFHIWYPKCLFQW